MSVMEKLKKFLTEAGPQPTYREIAEGRSFGAQRIDLTATEARWLVEHVESLERGLSQSALTPDERGVLSTFLNSVRDAQKRPLLRLVPPEIEP